MTAEIRDITEEEARKIAQEILTISYGWYEAVWRAPDGLLFSPPVERGFTGWWENDPGELLGFINGPGEDCSDLGLDPTYPPCRGVEWESADRDELIRVLADDIYEHPDWWLA